MSVIIIMNEEGLGLGDGGEPPAIAATTAARKQKIAGNLVDDFGFVVL